MAAARAGAAWAPMSASRVWISAMRCGSVAVSASASSAAALAVGGEHDLDQAFRPVGRLLGSRPMVARAGQRDAALLEREIADDGAKQGASCRCRCGRRGRRARRRESAPSPARSGAARPRAAKYRRSPAWAWYGRNGGRDATSSSHLRGMGPNESARAAGCQNPAAGATIPPTAASGRAAAENRGMKCA